jgi:hypothetical protein
MSEIPPIPSQVVYIVGFVSVGKFSRKYTGGELIS